MRFATVTFALVMGLSNVQELMPQSGKTWTREELLSRTVNPSREHQVAAWPPHKIAGNVYYVGTRNLGAFLITTDRGHILINTTFIETAPLIRQSIEKLGFRVEDIRIILASHAHGDHTEANMLFKEWTKGDVMIMAEDLPLLKQKVDRVLHDGDKVTLGNTTLTARLTPGHTPGTTTWTWSVEDAGRTYNVVLLGGGVNARVQLAKFPDVQKQYQRTFEVNSSLACDIPLGPHTPMYRMEEKHARIGKGPNPFIDPAGCKEEMLIQELTYKYRLEQELAEKK
jgi:metallo-beta-lactamase class B